MTKNPTVEHDRFQVNRVKISTFVLSCICEAILRKSGLSSVAIIALALLANTLPARADSLRLPQEFGRMEGPRDMNLFALEPSILNERFYTKGKAERHQYVGKVLPYGATIPDNEAPLCDKHDKKAQPPAGTSSDAPKTNESPAPVKSENEAPTAPTKPDQK